MRDGLRHSDLRATYSGIGSSLHRRIEVVCAEFEEQTDFYCDDFSGQEMPEYLLQRPLDDTFYSVDLDLVAL